MAQNGRKLSIWRGIAVRSEKQALTTHEGVKFAVYGRIFRSWRVPLCMCRRHGQGEVKKRDLKPRTSDEQALEVRSGRACAWMSVQQEQSAFLRILSGTVRKQASMARGMRLHNARCAIQQQEMAMEHAPARKKYIARASSVERRVGNDRKGTHSYEFGNKKPITFSYTVVLIVTTAPTIHDTIPSCHLYSPPSTRAHAHVLLHILRGVAGPN